MYVLIQVDCGTRGGGGLIWKNKWCSIALAESKFGHVMLESLFFLRAVLLSLGVYFNHFAAVYNPPPQAQVNGMPCLLSGQIIKMKTKHPNSVFRATGGMNSTPNTGKNTKYTGVTFTQTLMVHSRHSSRRFVAKYWSARWFQHGPDTVAECNDSIITVVSELLRYLPTIVSKPIHIGPDFYEKPRLCSTVGSLENSNQSFLV